MKLEYLSLLVCPYSGNRLILEDEVLKGDRIVSGWLVEPETGRRYQIRDFIPRFTSRENYAENFGVEWQIHSRTQYDEHSGFDSSSDRFRNETRWPDSLEGETILEVGSGSGRFTREALLTGATVVSLDYSDAVLANYASNGANERLLLVQTSVYEMPFRKSSFSRAFCFGVIQHTPDPQATFTSIVDMVAPGGSIASDVYIKDLFHWCLQTKYWVRPFIDRSDPQLLYSKVKNYVDRMWPLSCLIRRIPRIGYAINWRLLVADYSSSLEGADDDTLKGWAYLDTFDMLSPEYDYPQTVAEFRRWHENCGLVDIDVHRGYNGVEGRAIKPAGVLREGP